MIANGALSALKESCANRGAVLEEMKTGIAFALQSSLVVNSKALQDLDVSVLDQSITICASHKATGACRLGLRWGQDIPKLLVDPLPFHLTLQSRRSLMHHLARCVASMYLPCRMFLTLKTITDY